MARLKLMRRFVIATATIAATATATVGASSAQDLRFRVFLGDNPIGYHSFEVTNRDGEQIVRSEASFDVKLFFVPVYTYEHSNTEVWRGGCLSRIASQTDDNGKAFEVRGTPNEDGLRIVTQDKTHVIDGCVMTFAYWNREFLGQSRLLNSQTGQYIDVEVENLGPDVLLMGERRVTAEAYRILAPEKEVDITVWYEQQTGKWLALESTAKNGQLVRYVPANVDEMVIASRRSPTDS